MRTVVTNLSIWSSSSALSAIGTPGWSVRQSRTRPSLPPVTTLPSPSTATAGDLPVVGADLDRDARLVGAPQPHAPVAASSDNAPVGEHRHGGHAPVKRINVGAEFDWRVVEVTPQPHAAARVASDEAPIGYLGHRGHLLVPVAVAKDELDWHAGLVGAPQPYPAILAAAEDPAVGERG